MFLKVNFPFLECFLRWSDNYYWVAYGLLVLFEWELLCVLINLLACIIFLFIFTICDFAIFMYNFIIFFTSCLEIFAVLHRGILVFLHIKSISPADIAGSILQKRLIQQCVLKKSLDFLSWFRISFANFLISYVLRWLAYSIVGELSATRYTGRASISVGMLSFLLNYLAFVAWFCVLHTENFIFICINTISSILSLHETIDSQIAVVSSSFSCCYSFFVVSFDIFNEAFLIYPFRFFSLDIFLWWSH